MEVIHNGELLTTDDNILLSKWKSKTVFGEEKASKPSFCIFNNTRNCLKMLNKHIVNHSTIGLHTDVDVDGIGTTYILKKTLENISDTKHLLIINKDKIHGIQQKHVDYFKKRPIDLMIITDSSSNEIDIIKQFNCDVLCIDHHDLLHKDLIGKCNDGIHDYVIVNNTIANEDFYEDLSWLQSKNISAFNNIDEYTGTSAMSCGLVVYELMRLYCTCFANPKVIENLTLYKWAGVKLITDVIDTVNERNQWYLDNTFFDIEVESSLRIMMNSLNKFKCKLDKTYINYTFAPMINKAIRAGESAKALDIVINNPSDILKLSVYANQQEEAVNKALFVKIKLPDTCNETLAKRTFSNEYIELDISKYGIHPNYTGVIAGRLSGENSKNAAVYVTKEDGKCKGSFRGRYKNIDYRGYFEKYSEDIYAQGHYGAFGFECSKEQLIDIMQGIKSIEPLGGNKPYFTIGDFTEDNYGEYHIRSFGDFRKVGYILKVATGNSKVTSTDEIIIRVKASDVVLKYTKGKLFLYDVFGIECKAFKPLSGNYFDIYAEYTNEINMYIK